MNVGFLLITLVLVILNGFFVAMEFALVGSRRAKLEELAAGGSRRARTALDASSDLTMQLAGAQLGVTMASLGIGFFGEPTVAHFIEHTLADHFTLSEGVVNAIGLVIGLGIVVFFHMILGEVVPKNISLAGPEGVLLWLAPPSRAYLKVFRPVVRGLQAMANAGVRAFGIEPRDELTSSHTAEELVVMLSESHEGGLIEEFAHDLMTGVLDFGGRTVDAVMVPRDEIVAVPRRATVAEIERSVVESGHSRIPVVDTDIDSILGFVHSKDLLTLPQEAHGQPLPLRLVRRMLVVPTDRSLEVLLLSMRRERVHVALVREPNGATAGVVTLEDLLEELVGDILDESDHEEALEAELADALLDGGNDQPAREPSSGGLDPGPGPASGSDAGVAHGEDDEDDDDDEDEREDDDR
jgi:CBS domain containing-hemolysin-like protein